MGRLIEWWVLSGFHKKAQTQGFADCADKADKADLTNPLYPPDPPERRSHGFLFFLLYSSPMNGYL